MLHLSGQLSCRHKRFLSLRLRFCLPLRLARSDLRSDLGGLSTRLPDYLNFLVRLYSPELNTLRELLLRLQNPMAIRRIGYCICLHLGLHRLWLPNNLWLPKLLLPAFLQRYRHPGCNRYPHMLFHSLGCLRCLGVYLLYLCYSLGRRNRPYSFWRLEIVLRQEDLEFLFVEHLSIYRCRLSAESLYLYHNESCHYRLYLRLILEYRFGRMDYCMVLR